MLELQNISVCVESSREILKNINLTIEDSKFIVITGPNGGGKSTLAKVIAGILPPSSGRILFRGEDITNASITERAKMGIGYAFQQPVRFKGITVRDLITPVSYTHLDVYKRQEKAIAVYQNRAELTMCMPYMKERAESLSNYVLSETPNITIIVDSDMNIIEFNAAAEACFKISRREALEKGLYELIDVSDFQFVFETKQSITNKKDVYKRQAMYCTSK